MTTPLKAFFKAGVNEIEKIKVVQFWGVFTSVLTFFQNLGKMDLNGHILDSNGLISLKFSVVMQKWLISLKNSKFTNF